MHIKLGIINKNTFMFTNQQVKGVMYTKTDNFQNPVELKRLVYKNETKANFIDV